MKFFPYWSKAVATQFDRDGNEVSASCWRWSEVSGDDAHRSALAAAHRVLHRRMGGEPLGAYSYGQRPLREEVVQSQFGRHGELAIAVTRNAYGVLVLNTAQVMFIDVDLPPISLGASLRGFFSRLLGGKGPSAEEQQAAQARGRLEAFLDIHPDWGLRLYRTSAGLRMLVTHALFDPCADATQAQLESLGCDPLYMRLCRDQQCFRARLTPKPWRCEHTPNRVVWPHETDEQRRRFENWLAEYKRRQSGYATCRFLEALGVETVHPEVAPVVAIHDELSRALLEMPLA
ncbi:MAG: hypothetical protein RIC55_33745 [Pirellulaceae bacterium]